MSWTSGGGVPTRTFWVPSQMMTLDSGTRVTIGTSPDGQECVALADAATQGAYFAFLVPRDVLTGTSVTVQPVWIPGSTDGVAHTVRWSYDGRITNAGGDSTTAGTTTNWTGISAARTANILVADSITDSGLGTTWNGQDMVRFNIRRIGGDGADTYVGVVNLYGCRINYTPVL